MTWRLGLLVGVLAITSGGYIALYLSASARALGALRLLFVVFALGGAATAVHYRQRLTRRLLTANLALGSIVHLVAAGMVVVGDTIWAYGLGSAAQGWDKFLVGALGVMGAAITWTRARRPEDAVIVPVPDRPEPPPPATAVLEAPPDWEQLEAAVTKPAERQHLAVLHRVHAVLSEPGDAEERVAEAARVVRQEARRLGVQSAATAEEDDVLTQAADLLEWGAQKLPELAELDVSDLLMAKAIADIRSQHDAVETRFVDHRLLRAIHPIDRATAEEKCNERADAARAALPLLEANGMRLSEALITAEPALALFASITGFQVVQIANGEGYVTFEGNGRREALERAFGEDIGIEVEVRLYRFDDPEVARTIERRVQRVRRWKQVVDDLTAR